MTPHRFAEFLSLSSTVPTLTTMAGVVALWSRVAFEAVASKQTMTSHQWLMVGIVIGFLGNCLDNLYWSLPWSASYLKLDASESLMQAGVWFNIVFRQLAGIVAAVCHLRAYAMSSSRGERQVNFVIGVSWVGFAFGSLGLALFL